MALDSRINAYRADLADDLLRRRIDAKDFVSGKPGFVTAPVTGLRKNPENGSPLVTQALYGDAVKVFEQRDGWSWIQIQRDKYVGYVPGRNIAEGQFEATHQICVPATHIYPKADLKSQPAIRSFLNSSVCVVADEGKWCKLADGGYIYKSHLALIDEFDNDPAKIAARFLHTPYLWGGNSMDGIDCSGLVQQAFYACGRQCPRDSDMIEALIGEELADDTKLQRNDLVFWDGHVGIMADGENLIHANGHHMAVVIEKYFDAKERISKEYSSPPRVRRTTD